MTRTPRQAYTGNLHLDERLELARLMAEGDGRLRFVTDRGIYIKARLDCVCMGVEDWAKIENGIWWQKLYRTG